uniref:Uncharacterized protein n=1 Tax=Triticum urartu TaxID=4572 RepID=A0A8R7V228_TRIUA
AVATSVGLKPFDIAALPPYPAAAPRPAHALAAGFSVAHLLEHPPHHALDDVHLQELPPPAGHRLLVRLHEPGVRAAH